MFNNTFNRNRKDPLVDSIKAIMEDTNMRNQAEGLVCEAFGVFNANALANEDIEIFKDACEFVYSQLKEGVQLDELLGRGKLDAAVKSHLEKKGYTHTKSKDPEGGTRHSFEKAAKTPFKGEKKGFSYTRYKEKGEKHGDVNFGYYSKSAKSKKPNYGESGNDPESNLPSLVKSMKEGNDGNLANNYPPYDKVTRGDVIAGRLGKDQMGGKRKKMEEEQIDEISKELAARYEKKATKRAFGGKDDYMNYEGASKKKQARAMDKFDNRLAGIQRARKIQGKRKLGNEIVNEDVFEELYISINEQALYAIETNQLESFVNNLSEEEFDFLDEEIVNEIDMFMGKSTGSLGSTPRMSAMNSLSSSGATGKVSTMPKAKASPSTGSKNVVSKAQLQDFQKHNPGATLGQYMNATQGKTAIGGGKNDPSSSNFKADKTQGGQKWNAPTGTTTSDKPSIGSHDFAKSSTLGQTPSAGPSTPKPTQSASDWLHKPESQGGGGLDTVKASPSLKDQADAVAKAKPVVNNDMDKAATAIKSDNGAGLGGGGGANPPSAGLSMANDPKAKSIKEEKGFVTVGNMRIKLL